MLRYLFHLFSFICIVVCSLEPPPDAIVVGPDSQYHTIQSAIDAAQPGSKIFIKEGIYEEQLYITTFNLTIIGQSEHPIEATTNKVTIMGGRTQARSLNEDEDATLRSHGDYLRLYNVNLLSRNMSGAHTIPLSAQGDRQGYYGCHFKGADTAVVSEKGMHMFVDSLIEGSKDVISGNQGRVWFEGCDVRITSSGHITANGRNSEDNPSFFAFSHCTVDGKAGVGSAYLGRPRGSHARVLFQFSNLSAAINPAGWAQGDILETDLATVYLREYENEGVGAMGQRAGFAVKLKESLGAHDILPGVAHWGDNRYPNI